MFSTCYCTGLPISLLPEYSLTRICNQLVFIYPFFCGVFQIKCVKGDLFSCPQTDSLAHCISEDCRMGAGIAVLFKKKFGGVQELLDQRE